MFKFDERPLGLWTSAASSAPDIVAFCTGHVKSLGYGAGTLTGTGSHSPDGQTSTILNSRAFL